MSEGDYIRELNRLERKYERSLPEEKYTWWFNVALAGHWFYSLLGWFFPVYYSLDSIYPPPPNPTMMRITLIAYILYLVLLFKTENFWLCYVIPKKLWLMNQSSYATAKVKTE